MEYYKAKNVQKRRKILEHGNFAEVKLLFATKCRSVLKLIHLRSSGKKLGCSDYEQKIRRKKCRIFQIL